MALSNSLSSQFAKLFSEPVEQKPTEETVTGTAVEYAGKIYVQLDGSDQLTPIASSTVGMKDGDRITVQIKNHSVTATGNTTDPSASSDTVNGVVNDMEEVSDQITEFEIAIGDKVSVGELEAESARIDNLVAENVTIKEQLTANSANISDLEADNVVINEKLTAAEADIDRLDATVITAEVADLKYATIENLEATNADIHNLEADYGDFKELTTDNLSAVNADIDNLDATKLNVEDAKILYANIDFANIGEAAIENFFSKSGMIEDLVVGSGTVTGHLVGVTISGDLIEGNTIKADKLVVLGDDGLYYKLNVSAETVGAEQTEYNSINGSIITANTITAEKINVNDLVAFNATIGGFKIGSDSIYSGVKSDVDNTTSGIYMDDTGQFALGDSNNFLKYFKDTDGNWKLAISAQSITFGGTAKPFMVDSVEEFYLSDSRSELVGGSWSENAPASTEGKYIWRRSKITFSNDSVEYSPSETGVCISGSDGESIAIASTSVLYQASESGTDVPSGEWLPTIPTVEDGQYLWTQTVVTYSDGTSTTSYSVSRMGQNGTSGEDGRGVQSTLIEYQAGMSQTTPPSSDDAWSETVPELTLELPYLWTRTTITYTDDTTSVSYSVSSTLDSFSVGGRNFALGTGTHSVIDGVENAYVFVANLNTYHEITEDLVLTTSFDIKLVDGTPSGTFYLLGDATEATPEGGRVGYIGLTSVQSLSDYVLNESHHISEVSYFIDGTDHIGGFFNRVEARFVGASGTYEISNLKVERGNKATDWTPAPEDMATTGDVNNVKNDINNINTQLGAMVTVDAMNQIISQLVVGEDGQSMMTQTEDGFRFDFSSFQEQIEHALDTATSVAGEYSQVASDIDSLKESTSYITELNSYIAMGDDEGVPYIELGQKDGAFKVRITNTEMAFMQGTDKIAYITNNQLYIQSSVVTDEMKIGATDGFIWKRRGNGHMGLRWVSGDYSS